MAPRTCAPLFDYPRDQMVGQRIEILIPDRLGAMHQRHRDEYIAEPHTRPMGEGRDDGRSLRAAGPAMSSAEDIRRTSAALGG